MKRILEQQFATRLAVLWYCHLWHLKNTNRTV